MVPAEVRVHLVEAGRAMHLDVGEPRVRHAVGHRQGAVAFCAVAAVAPVCPAQLVREAVGRAGVQLDRRDRERLLAGVPRRRLDSASPGRPEGRRPPIRRRAGLAGVAPSPSPRSAGASAGQRHRGSRPTARPRRSPPLRRRQGSGRPRRRTSDGGTAVVLVVVSVEVVGLPRPRRAIR